MSYSDFFNDDDDDLLLVFQDDLCIQPSTSTENSKIQNQNCNDNTCNFSPGSTNYAVDNNEKTPGKMFSTQIRDGTQLYDGSEAEGFNVAEGSNYIYPTNYPIRQYQVNIVKTALFKNTLVSLPTGLGKTFIAAVVMFNYYRWYPNGKIVFMAPTRPLVTQQIRACHNIMNISQNDTTEMTGLQNAESRVKLWQDKRIFFLTPQVLVNDLKNSSCPGHLIKCLVVDEAHKAVKEYAYTQVVKILESLGCMFRVLALSATPGNDISSVQEVIKNLKISSLEIRCEESLDVIQYTHKRSLDSIVIDISTNIMKVKDDFLKIYDPYVKRLKEVKALSGNIGILSKFQILKFLEKFRANPPRNCSASYIGCLTGDFTVCMSLAHALELLHIYGLRAFYNYFISENHEKNKTAFTRLKSDNNLMKMLNQLEIMLSIKPGEENYVWGHPKLEKLVSIILDHFKHCHDKNEETKAIIFCQYRVVVNEVLEILESSSSLVKPVMFIGQSGGKEKGMTQKKQLQIMKDFRNGVYNCLVATCVAEEGLDIGEVDLIVSMEAHKSPIRLVQRMGRTGRKRKGQCIVLLAKGKEEKNFQEAMKIRKSYASSILNSVAVRASLYKDSPKMMPTGINPKACLVHITVQDFVTPLAKPKKRQWDLKLFLEENKEFIRETEYAKLISQIESLPPKNLRINKRNCSILNNLMDEETKSKVLVKFANDDPHSLKQLEKILQLIPTETPEFSNSKNKKRKKSTDDLNDSNDNNEIKKKKRRTTKNSNRNINEDIRNFISGKMNPETVDIRNVVEDIEDNPVTSLCREINEQLGLSVSENIDFIVNSQRFKFPFSEDFCDILNKYSIKSEPVEINWKPMEKNFNFESLYAELENLIVDESLTNKFEENLNSENVECDESVIANLDDLFDDDCQSFFQEVDENRLISKCSVDDKNFENDLHRETCRTPKTSNKNSDVLWEDTPSFFKRCDFKTPTVNKKINTDIIDTLILENSEDINFEETDKNNVEAEDIYKDNNINKIDVCENKECEDIWNLSDLFDDSFDKIDENNEESKSKMTDLTNKIIENEKTEEKEFTIIHRLNLIEDEVSPKEQLKFNIIIDDFSPSNSLDVDEITQLDNQIDISVHKTEEEKKAEAVSKEVNFKKFTKNSISKISKKEVKIIDLADIDEFISPVKIEKFDKSVENSPMNESTMLGITQMINLIEAEKNNNCNYEILSNNLKQSSNSTLKINGKTILSSENASKIIENLSEKKRVNTQRTLDEMNNFQHKLSDIDEILNDDVDVSVKSSENIKLTIDNCAKVSDDNIGSKILSTNEIQIDAKLKIGDSQTFLKNFKKFNKQSKSKISNGEIHIGQFVESNESNKLTEKNQEIKKLNKISHSTNFLSNETKWDDNDDLYFDFDFDFDKPKQQATAISQFNICNNNLIKRKKLRANSVNCDSFGNAVNEFSSSNKKFRNDFVQPITSFIKDSERKDYPTTSKNLTAEENSHALTINSEEFNNPFNDYEPKLMDTVKVVDVRSHRKLMDFNKIPADKVMKFENYSKFKRTSSKVSRESFSNSKYKNSNVYINNCATTINCVKSDDSDDLDSDFIKPKSFRLKLKRSNEVIKPKIYNKPVDKRFNEELDNNFDFNVENSFKTSTPLAKRKRKKKKKKKKNNFIEIEADESGEISTDDEDGSDLDDMDESFIHDFDDSIDIQAKYLESVKSPLAGKFKIPLNRRKNVSTIYSQLVEADNSRYINDSFCVDSDCDSLDSDPSLLEEAEKRLKENNLKRKRRRKNSPSGKNVKELPNDDSIENVETPVKIFKKKKFVIKSDSENDTPPKNNVKRILNSASGKAVENENIAENASDSFDDSIEKKFKQDLERAIKLSQQNQEVLFYVSSDDDDLNFSRTVLFSQERRNKI